MLTLDDPERRNAMTTAMGDALRERCAQLAADPELRAVVLTGTPPAFSAGGDLDMLEDLARQTRDDGLDATATMEAFYARFLAIRALPVPCIAAVNGHAVGAGLCVALAADLRILARQARVGLNFAKLGLHPGMGGSWFLPRLIGSQRAAAWLYTGALTDGEDAATAGLALRAVDADRVLDEALDLARQIASSSPLVVRQLKQTLNPMAEQDSLAAALHVEAENQAINYGSADLVEGLRAVRAREAPRFTGR